MGEREREREREVHPFPTIPILFRAQDRQKSSNGGYGVLILALVKLCNGRVDGGGGREVVCNGTQKLAIIYLLSIMGYGFKSLLEQSSTYLLIYFLLKHRQ
jgi:hypothetical protein